MKWFITTFVLLVITGCSLQREPTVEYRTVYISPDTSKVKLFCTTDLLYRPPTSDKLKDLASDELRFILMTDYYIQSLRTFGVCLEAVNGLVEYVERSMKQSEESP